MIALNKRDRCNQAEPYLYDCVSGECEAGIPGEIAEHVNHCPDCQGEIDRLKQALGELDRDVEANGVQAQKDIATCLKLHFNYIGKRVDCLATKPFFPLMAMPDFQVRMPTPITVHLNHCSQCRKDCNAIQELELTDSQLTLLSQIFTEEKVLDVDTQNITEAINAIATMDFQENAKGIKKTEQVRHILSSMARRDNSGVVTIYERSKDVEDQALKASDDLYAEWPISVQVKGGDKTQSESPEALQPAIASVGLSERAVPKFEASLFRRVVKPVAAAAVILFALSFFFNTSAIEAVGLKRIYDTLAKITHLHISRFSPQRPEPLQELWVSKPLRVTLIKTKNEYILWDLSNRVKKVKYLDALSYETDLIQKGAVAKIKKSQAGLLGLMPFPDVDDVPTDASWYQISDADIEAIVPGSQVFELVWNTKSIRGKNELRKWRCYLDPEKHLPLRVEQYEKMQGADKFVVKSIIEVRYIERNDVQLAIESASLQ